MNVPELHGRRLVLRAIREDDIEPFFALYSSPRMLEHHCWSPFPDQATAKRALNWMQSLRPRAIGIRWAITLSENNDERLIGSLGLDRHDAPNQCGEFAIELSENEWGKGYATEAIQLVLPYFFEKMCLNRLEAWTVEENLRSIEFLKKSGFTKEGIQRQKGYWKGRFHDLWYFSMLRTEFEMAERNH